MHICPLHNLCYYIIVYVTKLRLHQYKSFEWFANYAYGNNFNISRSIDLQIMHSFELQISLSVGLQMMSTIGLQYKTWDMSPNDAY